MNTAHVLGDLEERLARGERMTRADAERVFRCPDLVSVGVIGELARRARTGNVVTFGRVMEVGEVLPETPGESGELRLVGTPVSTDAACARVRAVVAWAQGRPVTGFTLADLATLCAGDTGHLTALSARLASDGLQAVAEVAVDRAASDADLIAQVQAVLAGGLGAWRATVERAEGSAARLELIERACLLQDATGAIRAFAPLPRLDPAEVPSTGYDDVKTVAAARVRCGDIERIQVDWPLYGPKLAQVAITFGANDLDGVSAIDTDELGPRRAPVEDIRRQIRSAGAEPVERDVFYLVRS
jgi:aminodeoxyfutalosine synthase